jgi:hypothetical protein
MKISGYLVSALSVLAYVAGQQLTVTTVSVLTTMTDGSPTVITTPITLTVADNGNCLQNPQGQCITYNVGCTLNSDLDYRCIYAGTPITTTVSNTSTVLPTHSVSVPGPSTTATATTTLTTPADDSGAFAAAAPCLAAFAAFLL